MQFGITSLSVVPVRAKPAHDQEQVTQLLFGDIYTIDETEENWLRITIFIDNYTGWIHARQNTFITEQQFRYFQTAAKAISAELVQSVTGSKSFPVLLGSTLYDFDGMNFKMLKENYVYAGKAIKAMHGGNNKAELIKKLAFKFLDAPYAWGGKTAFGIDCSGFTQVVFRAAGIELPRDAYQQAEKGKTVHFIFEAKEGDLLFFDNAEKKITHVGIYVNENEVLHASGRVRTDSVDHQGIFNGELKKYTHHLRIIKRLI